MRIASLFLISFFCVNPSFSQKVSVGIEGGPRSTFVYQNQLYNNAHPMYLTPGYFYGLKMSCSINEKLIVQSGYLMNHLQMKIDMSEKSVNEIYAPFIENFKQKQVPLHFIFNPNIERNIRISPLIGGSILWGYDWSKEGVHTWVTDNESNEVEYISYSSGNTVVTLDLGGVLTTDIGKDVSLQLSLLMSKGLGRVYQIDLIKWPWTPHMAYYHSFTNLDGFILGATFYYKLGNVKKKNDPNDILSSLILE